MSCHLQAARGVNQGASELSAICYLLFGALRANRDIETVLYNWRFGLRQQATTMQLLLRAPGRANLTDEGRRWQLISSFAGHEPRGTLPRRAGPRG
jgi:hypothetical protein